MNKKLHLLVILGFALAVFATTASAQNNSLLKGDYSFSFTGMTTGDGTTSTPFASVGRFTSDGAGNLTNGELDSNGVGPMEKAVALAFTGTYSIGADNRGVMNLNIPGGGTLAFAMLNNGNAKFVEVDASGNHGTVGSGTMEKVDTTAFNTARIAGDYAFGVAGQEQSNTTRTAIAGRFTANGSGMLSNGAADANQNGSFTTLNLLAGTYSVTDSTTGRGVMNLPPAIGGALPNLDFVFYVVNSGKLFLMDIDAVSPATPLLNGVVLHQQTPFSDASFNGGMVIYITAIPGAIGGGLITGNGIGTLTLTYDPNYGTGEAAANAPGTYFVAPDGRADIRRSSGGYAAAYFVSTNEAFLIFADPYSSFGFGEPQAAGPLTNSSVSGRYVGATTSPNALHASMFSGEFTADGASPTGTISGTQDIGDPSGASLGVAATATYSSISSFPAATPTNGKGTISGNFGTPSGNNIPGYIYVISPSKFVVLSWGNTSGSGPAVNAAILLFEQ